jgi:hypothetical protein
MYNLKTPTLLRLYLLFYLLCLFVIIISNCKIVYGKNIYKINGGTAKILKKIYIQRKKILLRRFAFLNGEKLTYKITYLNLINAGKAILQTYPGNYNSKKVCVIKASAYSAKWLRFFYYVHDKTFSYFSLNKYYPYFMLMKRHEGPHNDFTEERLNVKYDKLIKSIKYKTARKTFESKKYIKELNIKYNKPALYKDRINAEWKPYIAYKYTQDALSALYYLRMLNLRNNKSYYIPVYENRKRYLALVKTDGYYNIDTPAGKFNTIKVKAYLNFNGVFTHLGSLKIYLSTGINHTPVYLDTKIPIGYMTAILIKKETKDR